MNTQHPMPAAFIGHGSPMNTLERNRYTCAWRALGESLPRPRAVLAISAHWFIQGSALTAMQTPRVIHDFYGFPKALFDFDYPAPGAPDVAEEIADVVRPACVSLDRDSWGLDHGTWSVLAHVFPKADIPVVQLSIHAGEDIAYHLGLGARLAPLRERGIFILGSGNVVHNLHRVDRGLREGAFDWAEDFDKAVKQIMCGEPERITDINKHAAYDLAVPTTEHFLPLVYLAGLCRAAAQSAEVLIEGGAMGAITMTSYVLGARASNGQWLDKPAASLPDPRQTPPEHTNS